MSESALIIGTGLGLSASLARLCASKGMKVVLAARNINKLEDLASEINADTVVCDAGDIDSISSLFSVTDKSIGIPNLVV